MPTVIDKLEQDIPGARKVVGRDVAHALNMERPDEFNRNVLDLLASLSQIPPASLSGPQHLMGSAGPDRWRAIAAAILVCCKYRSRFVAYARAVTISLRAAQLARSCFWMAAAMRSGNRFGVQANEGIPRLASTCALC
jgi:hypothetical protein